jgi:exonuclease III
MRIISWNCQGGYRNKIDKILELSPTIAVIQECESLESLRSFCKEKIPLKSFWFSGLDHNKGVGIFFHGDYEILGVEHYSDIEFIIPMKIRNKFEFYLFAIWAMAPICKDKDKSYTYQIEKTVTKYEGILKNNLSILIGDYNTPHIEEPVEISKFEVVESFKKLEIFSAYHEYFKKGYGEHNHYTFYQHKNIEFKHMLDYCFASKSIIERISNVEIGKYEGWIKYSDHCPLIVEIDGF